LLELNEKDINRNHPFFMGCIEYNIKIFQIIIDYANKTNYVGIE